MDIAIILSAFVVGVISVTLAYRLGGRSWTTLGAIRGPVGADGRRLRPITFKPRAGVLGEIAALSILCLLVLGVDFLTDDVSIWGLMQQFPAVAVSMFALICCLVIAYDVHICGKARKDGRSAVYRARLNRGYTVYLPYSIVNFSFMILIVSLAVAQTFAFGPDVRAAQEALGALVARLGDESLSPDDVMVVIEQMYGVLNTGASLMVDQINALVLLVFCSFGARVLVKYTPISQVYEETSLLWFDRLLFLSIGFVAVAAWYLHYFSYEVLFTMAMAGMDAQRAEIAEGGWQMLQRFNDLYLDLSKRRGLTGFMIALTSDRGGLLLALGASVWLIDRRQSLSEAARDSMQSLAK